DARRYPADDAGRIPPHRRERREHGAFPSLHRPDDDDFTGAARARDHRRLLRGGLEGQLFEFVGWSLYHCASGLYFCSVVWIAGLSQNEQLVVRVNNFLTANHCPLYTVSELINV